MSLDAATIVVLPKEVASAVVTAAISRSAWAVSMAMVVLAVPVLVDVFIGRSIESWLPVPLAAMSVTLAALVLYGWKPSNGSRIAFLVVGSASAIVYCTSIHLADPTISTGLEFLVNRLVMPLVLVGASISRPVLGLMWAAVGFASAYLVLWVSAVIGGGAFSPGWAPILILVIYCTGYLAIAAVRLGQSRAVPDLARLEAETRRLDLESQFEQRAAAIIHDTVLNDLTVVMTAASPLDERTRDRLRADVATLSDPSWLRESAPEGQLTVPVDTHLRNAMLSLVSEYQWRGLTVDVTGDSTFIATISPEAAAANVAAVRACLENVLQHAGTGSAELVLGTTPNVLTAMIVDHGVGFSPAGVASDRLGLRASVVSRIEAHGGTVRVWSSPGSGTSVLISMPNVETEANHAE